MHSSLGLSKLRLIFLLIASLAVGGLAGLMAVALCALVMRFGGTEAPDKHGISVQQSVRVGGVLIAIYLALYIGYQYFLLNASTVTSGVLFCTVASISFFMLGLQEDLKGNLSAVVRFILMLALAGAIVWLRPDYRLVSLGVPLLDELLLGSYMATVVFAVLGLVFLANAFNTADGANGLASGVGVFCALGLALVLPADMQLFMRSVAVSCLLFLIYNLTSGRFFLGDGGAYLLGAAIGLCAIQSSNTAAASTWFLLSLLFYPVADLTWSVIRRIAVGRSPLTADNGHLHNYVFDYVSQLGFTPKRANTSTGLGLAILFSAIPLALFYFSRLSDDELNWLAIYASMWVVYLLMWVLLSTWRTIKLRPKRLET